jgi:hypothetical protein
MSSKKKRYKNHLKFRNGLLWQIKNAKITHYSGSDITMKDINEWKEQLQAAKPPMEYGL